MTNLYNLQIYAVDGITIWSIQTDDPSMAHGFLKDYDHKGSSTVLCVDDLNDPDPIKSINSQLHDEAAYECLVEQIKGEKE